MDLQRYVPVVVVHGSLLKYTKYKDQNLSKKDYQKTLLVNR